eukprot:scaffold57151_cov62-Phaeocystis_antarctica.AAC.3
MPNHELHTARATRGALRPRGSSFSGAAAENTSKVESESESQALWGRGVDVSLESSRLRSRQAGEM